ncbi:hypothetical protein [Spiroplasma sp. DGKH1]|uniref:hypothetical protein n=1 Tax=Spiroplasma sp. DGKH1 TaxID=3050074 RepID=UPI0034C6C49C
MFLFNDEFSLSILIAFIIIQAFFLTYLLITYQKIIIPYPNENYSSSKNITAFQIIDKYLVKNNITNLNVVSHPEMLKINRCYRHQTFVINDLQIFNRPYTLTGLGLDYVLGRLFYASEIHQKNNQVRFLSFWLYWAPAIFNILFYIFVACGVAFYILVKIRSDLLNNNIIYIINKLHLFTLLATICFGLFLLTIGVNNKLKQNLENLYEQKMTKFVKSDFPELYYDWGIARRYSRSIHFTYTFGCSWIFQKNYKYTGPFGL